MASGRGSLIEGIALHRDLHYRGFAIIPHTSVPDASARSLTAIASASAASGWGISEGSTNVRINGLLSREPDVAAILMHPSLLEAARVLVGSEFKLSSFHGRHVRPQAAAQRLHQDVSIGADGWPLLGFIYAVSPFGPENGATTFAVASHHCETLPDDAEMVQAVCPAGSLILFNGSVWHGHGANHTRSWRYSIQGAFIPRAAIATFDFRQLDCEQLARLPAGFAETLF
jgi:hypothetical protein